jgi:hypothetical protein
MMEENRPPARRFAKGDAGHRASGAKQHMNRGVILTGTRSSEHLTQNLLLFES